MKPSAEAISQNCSEIRWPGRVYSTNRTNQQNRANRDTTDSSKRFHARSKNGGRPPTFIMESILCRVTPRSTASEQWHMSQRPEVCLLWKPKTARYSTMSIRVHTEATRVSVMKKEQSPEVRQSGPHPGVKVCPQNSRCTTSDHT